MAASALFLCNFRIPANSPAGAEIHTTKVADGEGLKKEAQVKCKASKSMNERKSVGEVKCNALLKPSKINEVKRKNYVGTKTAAKRDRHFGA